MSWRRLLAAGLAIAAVAGLAGGALEWWWFGASDAATASRVEARVRRQFDGMTAVLSRITSDVAQNPAAAARLAEGSRSARSLFDLVASARHASGNAEDLAVTVYDSSAVARAWAGRPSDIPPDRITGPTAFFVTPSPVGLRLVHVEPIMARDSRRVGTVAAEHILSPAAAPTNITVTDYTLTTSIAPVSLRMRWEGAGDRPRSGAFLLRAPSGDPVIEASISPEALRAAREQWRRQIVAIVMMICGAVIILLIGPFLDRRGAANESRAVFVCTLGASALLMSGTAVLWLALAGVTPRSPDTAVRLMLAGSGAAALVALWAGPAARLRVALRNRRRAPRAAAELFATTQLLAGVLVALILVAFERLLGAVVDPASVDLRHFSLHPWNATRILLLGGVLSIHAAALWAAALVLVAAPARWRLPRRSMGASAIVLILWLVPTIASVAVATARGWPLPSIGAVSAATACGIAALLGQRVVTWYRHTTVAARILALFVAFLVPALLLYPSIDFFAERATRRLITTRYAVEAEHHGQALQERMEEARREIDALTILPDLVSGTSGVLLTAPRTESAFLVWNQTVLGRARLTSAVELFDRDGTLISRFALNLPEYTGTVQKPEAAGCAWELFGEANPFGSEWPPMWHAERNICEPSDDGQPLPVGTVVLHVLFDYRTLPFITSQSPYFEIFRPTESGAPREGTTGSDVDVAIYGWGLRPIYTSGRAAWPISESLFQRIYASRAPFWARVPRGDRTFHVYFSNDRAAIYAIGYPTLSLFDHLVHVAELTTLAGVAFVFVLLGTALYTRISRSRPRVGRALLREIRASFYRKLFLAFVLAAIVPALTLALVIRAYFADLLRDDVQAEAARTAAVAQRVIEESDALLRRSADGLAPVSDDVMVWISQVIDQDVNIFDGPRLIATSERDLFASGLLATRTPDAVYRAIALQHLPSFVAEDQIGAVPYTLAAAPVRAGGHDWILTVPLANQQREIDREIDDLDRGVHLAALFFVLLGAGIGLSLAERIADPVRRLTRATRRIAGGDFDARIAVRSADELKRLVDAFNSMAGELKAQRAQLERTHRLEAWAEMARQVAHEIKNPLTPIQLSAEHLRRVHADRGAPMSPVLEGCVSSILGQVRLLRQIAAEFSSFASSPNARPAPVDVRDLIAEVINPYRTGLAGRIEVDNRATGDLPRVYADRTLIARALANIVENALHAMPGAGRLTIDAEANDAEVAIHVRDTGVGMDEDALARVFEPYFSTKHTGTGLGLPIARRNIELNGGSIAVESQKGVGTIVTVRLPVAG